jgi:hypothetical protein
MSGLKKHWDNLTRYSCQVGCVGFVAGRSVSPNCNDLPLVTGCLGQLQIRKVNGMPRCPRATRNRSEALEGQASRAIRELVLASCVTPQYRKTYERSVRQ